jgi:AcrR family transcriptional regulator
MSNPVPSSTTKDRILDVAVSLFASAGFDGVSMRGIAAAVGIQAASLYNHFHDKEALYLGAMAHVFADKARGISETAPCPRSA